MLIFCSNPCTMITIYAGPEQEKSLVHKDFACHYSSVLKAALNSTFIEGETQAYNLDDVCQVAVRLLVHWLYTQSLADSVSQGDSMNTDGVSPEHFESLTWSNCKHLLP